MKTTKIDCTEYSEKNYQENINNKNLRFFSARPDAFGARMTAILNAMYCSKKFGIPFAFCWSSDDGFMRKTKIGENQLLGQHAGKAEEVFSRDFLENHRFPDEIVNQFGLKNGVDFCDFGIYNQIENFQFENLLYYKPLTSLGWSIPCGLLSDTFDSINKEEYKKICKECWNEIGFSDEFSDIMKKVDNAVQKKGKFVAIHVRSGDVVYTNPSYLGKKWLFIAELAVETIVRELPFYDIVLSGEDITSLQRMIEFVEQLVKEKQIDCHGHSVIMAKDLVENNTYEGIKLAFYDCYVLSKGEKIFISSRSTYARLASLLSDTNETYCCYDYFSLQEQFDSIYIYINKLNLHPAQQAYSYLHLLELSEKLGKPFEEQLLYAMKMLSAANSFPQEMSYPLMMWKMTYLLFLMKNCCYDLFYKFVNRLTLSELKRIMRPISYFCVIDSINEQHLEKILFGIFTSDFVRNGHYFSNIKGSITGNDRKWFNTVYKKNFFKFRVLFYNLFNMKLHN